MSSTPMDIDHAASNGSSLNIHRTLGGTSAESNLSDVISTFRPTKVRSPPAIGFTLHPSMVQNHGAHANLL